MRFGGLGIYKKIRNKFSSNYETEKYWRKRGKKYIQESENDGHRIQEKELVDYLKEIKFNSVLEAGCGFGRITKLMSENFDIKYYSAFDLSLDQINNAKTLCDEKINFEISTINEFSNSMKYDVVLCVDVLLHIEPENIQEIIKKLISHSKKYFIHIDPHILNNYDSKINLKSHYFKHDYQKIYSSLGLKYKRIPITKEQSIFIIFLEN
jgi:2-polyprenyl-3-methyl-5-hydroxy-6-metoxy-1,4-benzoquinol methylase